MRKATLIACVFIASTLVFFLGSEKNRSVFFDASGSIDRGKKFGIATGVRKMDAIASLKDQGFTNIAVSNEGYCADQKLSGQEFIYAFDLSWRHGTICLAIENEVVKTVNWNFNILSP